MFHKDAFIQLTQENETKLEIEAFNLVGYTTFGNPIRHTGTGAFDDDIRKRYISTLADYKRRLDCKPSSGEDLSLARFIEDQAEVCDEYKFKQMSVLGW